MDAPHAERLAAKRRSLRTRWISGRGVLIRARLGVGVATIGANLIGAVAVFVVAAFIVPEPHLTHVRTIVLTDAIAAAVYVAIGVPVGAALGHKGLASLGDWLPAERPPTATEQLAVLRGPRVLTLTMGLLWGVAAVLFGLINGLHSVELGIRIAIIVGFSGMVTCSVCYLFAERLLREAAGRALAVSEHPQRIAQSVTGRALSTWLLGTGVPVLGVVLLGAASLGGLAGGRSQLALAMVVLGANCLLVGFVTTVIAARATADPVRSVRRALARIEAGDFAASVPVYDGTEIGLLQAGFNQMATGLREREQLRDLFGRHVGVDVARQAVEQGVALGGEQRQVAVLFVDLVGSTALATERSPSEVVELLNRFFAIVVEVVETHGGLINKFTGDAALAIFGAPTVLPQPAGAALTAARTLAARLIAELPETDFGVGVAAGLAVAGNIGTPRRLEYTVIGDPVNEAARLTEIAKTMLGRVAASGDVVEAAGGSGGAWALTEEVVVRGRQLPTRIHRPVDSA